MPTIIKCTAFFGSDAGHGWSESHFVPGGNPPVVLLDYIQSFKTLMDNFRRPLLGKDCYIKGLRVSYKTDTGAIASSAYRYTPYSYPGNQREGSAPSVSAKVRMGDSTNTQFSDIHLRGFWDAVEKDEALDFTTAAGTAWKQLLDQFTDNLVGQNYGFMGQEEANTIRGKITGYTTDANGFVQFSIEKTSGPALPAAGTLRQFRAAKLNGSKSILNRTMIVEVDSPITCKTVVPTAAGEFVSDGTFVMRETNYVGYTGVQYTILGKRSMGRPTLQSLTRARAMPRA